MLTSTLAFVMSSMGLFACSHCASSSADRAFCNKAVGHYCRMPDKAPNKTAYLFEFKGLISNFRLACGVQYSLTSARQPPLPCGVCLMNRTLLLLNALALAVLAGLILQPERPEASAQALAPSTMRPHLVEFGNMPRSPAASALTPAEQPRADQRLIF
ncbi:MAG: hypothetical protein RSE94_12575 [Pseudomonas sp.]